MGGGSGILCSVTRSCPTFCDWMDYSLPGYSVHGIFQARILHLCSKVGGGVWVLFLISNFPHYSKTDFCI